jgi:hypothetical protein
MTYSRQFAHSKVLEIKLKSIVPKDHQTHERKIFISPDGSTSVLFSNEKLYFHSHKNSQIYRKISLNSFIKDPRLQHLIILNK